MAKTETASSPSSSKDKGKSHRSSGGSNHGPSSQAQKEPRRRELMFFWYCCECGEGPMTKGTDKVCLEVNCQRPMCRNCPTEKKIIYPSD
ncbi:hypothetical protein CONLIGDRAFT_679441 [Coniochaeta ligniaria NRRL 30616]|uniref:Uncharacterized protein n=1 Tax=Coniochaeta ligniaria NRRL 30616 TaxID=1408157 RepID=A0A1J7JLE8_9PEZI|nr:hypothetical protein CONLIGDRAFT_679441 [Coniochaeta ligniaria NRRL 30616]